MVVYMKTLGVLLIGLGLAGSLVCGRAATNDEAYFQALKGLEKYPANVLYQTEFKMAEPRHMILLGGAWSAAPAGLVFGSLCLGLATLLGRD